LAPGKGGSLTCGIPVNGNEDSPRAAYGRKDAVCTRRLTPDFFA
jgi:hypothetical protein